MIKVLLVFGTRPEAIKLAPVVSAMRREAARFSVHICATAQHRGLLDEVLGLFSIHPDSDLNLMRENQALSDLTARLCESLDAVLSRERPDWVLVQGDTTSAMVAGLVAYYHQIKVGHVEAGLRSGDKFQPFPEELNRRMLSLTADLHFAPTGVASGNLISEGIPEQRVVVTGNTVIDALLDIARRNYDFSRGPLATLPWHKRLILLTAHRRENFGAPLQNVCRAVQILGSRYAGLVHFVYPVHPNPNVQEPVRGALGAHRSVSLLPPLPYDAFIQLMRRCSLILTDSGGLQEEAPSLGKPLLLLRNTTERPEAVRVGATRLVGTETERIVTEVSRLLDDPGAYASMAAVPNPFGDGHASERICRALLAQDDEEGPARVMRPAFHREPARPHEPKVALLNPQYRGGIA